MRTALLLTAVCLVLLGLPLPAGAAERNVSDVVLVDSGAVIADDLYAAGNRVIIQGRVDGDLVVSAFEDVTISGTVTGDVIAFSSTADIDGRVGGSVRFVGRSLTVGGEVGGDIVAVGWDTTVGGDLAGDLIVWSRRARLEGAVGGDVEGQMRSLVLAGSTDGNVDVTVGSLAMTEGATVGGDLGYRSREPSQQLETGGVEGAIIHRTPLPPNIRVRAMLLLAKVVLSLAAGVMGLLVMWAAPRASAAAAARVRRSWGRAWLRGTGFSLVPLVVAAGLAGAVALVPLEAALPLLVALVPVVLALFGMVGALALVAPAAVYPWLGDPRGRGRPPVRAFLFGLALVTGALLVPWLGGLAAALIVPIGIGGWLGGEAAPTRVAGGEAPAGE